VGQPEGVELANRACSSLEELAAAAEQGVGRVRASPSCWSRSCTRQGFPYERHIILRDSVTSTDGWQVWVMRAGVAGTNPQEFS
jgi:hypothetical protein